MLNYKKIGDTITTPELNAIIWLLQKYEQITEQIILTPSTHNGEYGDYTLNGEWTVYHESYTPNGSDFTINVQPVLEDDYELTVTIKKIGETSREYKTLLENNTFTIPATEFEDGEILSVYAKIKVV